MLILIGNFSQYERNDFCLLISQDNEYYLRESKYTQPYARQDENVSIEAQYRKSACLPISTDIQHKGVIILATNEFIEVKNLSITFVVDDQQQ